MLTKPRDIQIEIPADALNAVFDECDRYDYDETGGRLVGHYTDQNGILKLTVTGVLEPGPAAERTPTYFMQDGKYQERTFRQLEASDPQIEHLGNWHTHHVNGLQTLSGGDLQTYRRIVSHEKHNTSFFYALLVVRKQKAKEPLDRYTVKHFIFRRGDEVIYEVPHRKVKVTKASIVWPNGKASETGDSIPREASRSAIAVTTRPERVYDKEILEEFFPDFRPFASQELGVYWRGKIPLADGSQVQVVVLEQSEKGKHVYTVMVREPVSRLLATAEQLASREFESARSALITTERACNFALFRENKSRA